MFCYQCEQTAKGQGCTVAGVCGKTADVAALQDLLVYMLRGLSQLSIEAGKAGVKDENIDVFTCEALFSTLTNVNFDPESIAAYIRKTAQLQEQLRSRLYAIKTKVNSTFNLQLEKTTEGLVAQGKHYGINSEPTIDPDLHSLQWLLTYGLKGVAAYTYHAYLLGKKDSKVFDFIHEGLAAPFDKSLGVNEFVGLVFKCGEINIRAMELLDAGNTETYGHPVPTKVPLGHKKGKAILVSGHDLIDLEHILKQSQGQRHLRLHSRRNASHPRLSKTQQVPAFLRSLWNRMAKPAKRIRSFSRRNIDDDKLHPKTRRKLQRQHFHFGTSRIPRRTTHKRQRLLASNTESLGNARFPRRHGRQKCSGWVSAETQC